MKSILLQCTISDGLFPEERCASFPNANGETVDIFVPSNLLQDGCLEVALLEEGEGLALIRLPVYSATVTPCVVVKSNQIRPKQKVEAVA